MIRVVLFVFAMTLPNSHAAKLPLAGSQDLARVRLEASKIKAEREEKERQDKLAAEVAEKRAAARVESQAWTKEIHTQLESILSEMNRLANENADAEEVVKLYDTSIKKLGVIRVLRKQSLGAHSAFFEIAHDELAIDIIASAVADTLPHSSSYRIAAKPDHLDNEVAARRLEQLLVVVDLFAEKQAEKVSTDNDVSNFAEANRQEKSGKNKIAARAFVFGLGATLPVGSLTLALAQALANHYEMIGDNGFIVPATTIAAVIATFWTVTSRSFTRGIKANRQTNKELKNAALARDAEQNRKIADEARAQERNKWLGRFISALERRLGVEISAEAREAVVAGQTQPLVAMLCGVQLTNEPVVRVRVSTGEREAELAYEDQMIDEAIEQKKMQQELQQE